MSPHLALAIGRFLGDTGLGLVWGGGGFALISAGDVRLRLLRAIRAPLLAASALAAIASFATLVIQAADIASDWTAAFDPDLLKAVALCAHAGLVLALRALSAAAAFSALLVGCRKSAVLLSGLTLGEAALTGHAAGAAKIATEALHILAGTAWLGALVPFLLVIRMAGQPELRTDAVLSLRRFSRIGHGVVALVLATGLANCLQILGHLPVNLQSPYQAKLALKIGAVLVMTAIAIANRYVAVPMQRRYPQRACRFLLLGSLLEITLGLSALALVASFGIDDPA